MHVDLVEALRCPHGHEDGWLVAATDLVVDRRIVRGTIGCPVCGGEWRVEDGALDFEVALNAPTTASLDASSVLPLLPPNVVPFATANTQPEAQTLESSALRLAALLDLRDATGAVVLVGEAARMADALAALTGVLILAVNTPPGVAVKTSLLRARTQLPLGVGTMRGAALDHIHGGAAWMSSVMRAVQQGGRVVAPANVTVPGDVRELARDGHEWVGEVRVAASGLVPLRRGGDPLR